MKKAVLLITVLLISVISTACINNFAVQELNIKAKEALDKGDYETAISRLESSIDLDSTILETHYNLGIAYTEAEKYEKAVEAFEATLKLNPKHADTYYSLAVAQENFAKSLIDGSYYKDEEKDSAKASDDDDEIKPYEVKDDDKTKIVELFTNAIDSYNKYLEFSPDAKERAEIEASIAKLNSDIEKYQK